jgi:hypothetical protein
MDNLLVTPTIGINYKANFPLAFKYKEILLNAINKSFGENEFKIQVNKENPIAMIIQMQDGFTFTIDQHNSVVSYNYPIIQKRKPGRLPTIESNEIKIYSELLDDAKKHIKFIWSILNQDDIHKINRLGLMAVCNIEKAAIPPGLDQYVKHFNKPWDDELDTIEGSIIANIQKTDTYYEKCHHILKYSNSNNVEDESEVNLNLDYQRYFNEVISIPTNKIDDVLNDFIKTSLNYFEKFGQGDLNYE